MKKQKILAKMYTLEKKEENGNYKVEKNNKL